MESDAEDRVFNKNNVIYADVGERIAPDPVTVLEDLIAKNGIEATQHSIKRHHPNMLRDHVAYIARLSENNARMALVLADSFHCSSNVR